jgi:hypothetical protein
LLYLPLVDYRMLEASPCKRFSFAKALECLELPLLSVEG